MSLPKLAFEVWAEFPFISQRLAIRDFSRLSCQRVTCTPFHSAMNMARRSPRRCGQAMLERRILPTQPARAVSPIRFPAVRELPTFPRVRLARPSLWPANSRLSALDWWLCGTSLRSPFSNFRFGIPETGPICGAVGGDCSRKCACLSDGLPLSARQSTCETCAAQCNR